MLATSSYEKQPGNAPTLTLPRRERELLKDPGDKRGSRGLRRYQLC